MESKCTIDSNGIKRWRNSNGHLHHEDGPAIEYGDYFPGATSWYIDGIKYKTLNKMPLSLFLVYIKYHLRDIIKS